MNITFDNYRLILDPGVVKRGGEYYKKGRVLSCEEMTPGHYHAIVGGTENYHVYLSVKEGNVSSTRCDCPYDTGPVCKHVVAAIHFIQNNGNPAPSPAKERVSAKKKAKGNPVAEILGQMSENEIRSYIKKKSSENPEFKREILSDLSRFSKDTSVAFYKNELSAVLRGAKSRGGFIEWHSARYVGNFAYNLVQNAKESADGGNFATAAHICTAIFEKLIPALQYADDSNGDIGGPVNAAMDLLRRIAEKNAVGGELTRETRDVIFALFDKGLFSGWDWNTEILSVAASLASSEADYTNIFNRLAACEKSDFAKESAMMIRYDLLLKTKRHAEADELLEKNISLPAFRRKAIDTAIKERDYARAEKLAHDGVEQNKKLPGLVCDWQDRLLQIAEATGNTDEIIRYARTLYLSSTNPPRDYYEILKTKISRDEWQDYVDGLISEIRRKNHWVLAGLIPKMYIAEKRWKDLLTHAGNKPSFTSLERFEKYLKKDYAEELADLYGQCILQEISMHTGRPFYKTICRYIRRMQKLGAHEKAERIAQSLRNAYPQRKALIEELAEF